MEWLALPPLEANIESAVYLGFVCKGDYPSLDLVEYTVVRLSCLGEAEGGKADGLIIQLLSSSTTGDNNNDEWIEYRVSCESLQVDFCLSGQRDTVIVSNTTTTTNNQGGGGSRRILVYFLVMVRLTRSTAIAAIKLNEGDDPSLRMFETPGPDRGKSVFYCADYMRGFDDGRVIHYVRIFRSTDFEFWVFNTESGEWYLRHRARLETMMLTKGYPWTNVRKWESAIMFPKPPYVARACYHVHAFHPMNPDLIFLTLYGKFACYNVKTGMLELVYDFDAQNMYSAAALWRNASNVRALMKERGLRKDPGCSFIEHGGKVYRFVVGDQSHPESEKIYSKLEELITKMQKAGYVSKTEFVLHDVDEEVKEDMISKHSEKLAIAFGLLVMTNTDLPILITKNLCICGDCHNAVKFISLIEKQRLVIRDSKRFHHFVDGLCSCGDYW